MVKRVKNYIKKYNLIKPDEHILVGVSGGADSVCLFFLLHELSKELSFQYSVIHVNHQIRQTAERDELFVKKLCSENQIPFYVSYADVPKMAKEQKLSLEEAARIARYDAFYERAGQLAQMTGKKVKLAVAHNENDQAETVLFHLFRGCSLSGLRGMKPMRLYEDEINLNCRQQSEEFETDRNKKIESKAKIPVIRPLLCVSRKEIENYLSINGYTHIEDETNAYNEYSRNFIRNELLTQAEESVCKGVTAHIADAAEKMLTLEDYLHVTTGQIYENLIERKGENSDRTLSFPIDRLKMEHSYMQHNLIYKAITELAGVKKDITGEHVEQVLKLLSMQVGKQVHLPYQIVVKKGYEAIYFVKAETFLKETGNFGMKHVPVHIPVSIPGETRMPDGSLLHARVFPYDKTSQVPKNKYTKWFDYDKILGYLIIRNRECADYFYMDKEHTKQVKRYMIDEKIDKDKRDLLLLICEDKHMLWMPGFRISEYYKIEESTKTVLELTITV